MKTNRLGKTDLMVSELGFGAFAIGGNTTGNSYGPTDDAASVAAIRTALELGCTFFDTADVYGNGHSEQLLGRALREARRSSDVVVATKGGGRFSAAQKGDTFTPAYIAGAVEASLRRLDRDYIDLYQLHNPPQAVLERGELFDALDRLKAAGKIRHVGVSIHTVADGEACLRDPRCETMQLVYNLFSLADPEQSLDAIFEPARAHDVGLIAREPLAAGFLSGRHGIDTQYGPGDNRGTWPPGRRRLFNALANSLRRLEQPGVTLVQAALRFVLDEPAIATTIVGIKTPTQAIENFGATRVASFPELESGTAAVAL